MPTVKDIDKFNETLVTLGNEPEVLSRWGEALEHVETPNEEIDGELNDLLEDVGSETGEGSNLPPPEDGTDFEALMESLNLDAQEEEPQASFEEESEEETAEDFSGEAPEEFDLESDFSGLDETPEEAPEETPEEAPDESGEPDEEEFSLEGFNLDDDFFAEPKDAEEGGPDRSAEEEPVPPEEDEFAMPEMGEALEDDEAGLPEGGEELSEPEVPSEFSIETPEGEELFPEEEQTEGPGEGDFSAEEFNLESGDEEETFALDEESLEGGGEEDFEIDEFSLGDFGAEFGIDDETAAELEEEDQYNPANELPESPEQAEDIKQAGLDDYSISPESFGRIKKTLGALPLNLKIAVEEQIAGGSGTPDQIKLLLRQLGEGAPIGEIASTTGAIRGKKIRLPEGFEKRSGYIFEEERNSFSYRIKQNVLPVLKVAALTLASAAALGFLSYRFIYRPLNARNLYAAGYENIGEENYSRSEDYFDRAVSVLPRKGWFYRYAEGYENKDEYILAEEKYEELLARYPSDRKGHLDFARFESETLANYERAERILNRWLEDEMYDYDALLLAGDNYMKWGEEDAAKYEDARNSYVTLLRRYGEENELLFRMLSYFIAVDNYQEVVRLKNLFQSDPGVEVEPLIYARLGGYLLDKGDFQEVRDILVRAMNQDKYLPEIHYNLSRYYRRMKNPLEEEKALKNARSILLSHNPLSAERTRMLVDTYGRLGEVYYNRKEYQKAQENLSQAVERYERSLEADLFEKNPRFGSFYSLLGDIRYYAFGEFNAAYDLYNVAESHGYVDPEMNYKRGVILYKNKNYRQGLTEFSIAEDEFWNNRNIIYAFGNTMYRLGNYYPAQGFYETVLNNLLTEKQKIDNLFPEEDEKHDALLKNIYKVQNNLGITLIKLGDQYSNPSFRSEGLAKLTESSENYDNYSRDTETMVRSRTKNLAYLNQRNAIMPQSDYDLEIYGSLPLDSKELYF